ncbi:MAG: coproporphyrinogen III oxidase family protein [Phycisphaerales bacterium]|nr:coproporphyrinogen III oxidase family protein [Phycisphaerales bacterium]
MAEPPDGNYFVSAYPPFSAWTVDQVETARRGLNAPPAAPDVPLGLYIHLPFCVQRCTYCYYLAFADRSRKDMEAYVDLLLAEAKLLRAAPALAGREINFVYFGGGTPSFLPIELLRRLLTGLSATFPMSAAREVTFECAPQTATQDKLAFLRETGVTRLSLGVQSFHDDILALNGRVHTSADVDRAWRAIRRVGFPVTNLDLMVGLLGESDVTTAEDVRRTIALEPESVTIYQLEMPHYTPLHREWREGRLPAVLPGWDEKRRRLAHAFAQLEQAGYTVRSAYSAVRDPVRHRFVYQDEQYRGADLAGLGIASFSYVQGVHYQNTASLDEYASAVRTGLPPIARACRLSAEEQARRELILQLKLGEVDAALFFAKFGIHLADRFGDELHAMVARGWARESDHRFLLTREGLLRADFLAREFFLPRHRTTRYN